MLNSSENIENIINICSDDIDKQTEAAFKLSLEYFSHQKVMDCLKSEESQLKHLALIKIQEIKNQEEAILLVNCLKDKDSRVRELASYIIKSLENFDLFLIEENFKVFINSIEDSNPSVCRNIADILVNLVNKTDYPFIIKVIDKINSNIELNNIFPLYWSLYTLEKIIKNTSISNENLLLIKDLLKKTAIFKEYQIREQTAFIVKTLLQVYQEDELLNLADLLRQDSIFYVKRVLMTQ